MDNQQLFGAMQAFVSVVECGSFSASARHLGVSQPTVSRQVTWLESKLEVRLLQRSTRRISLTEAGKIYYAKVSQIQRDVTEANMAVKAFREHPSGVLRISAPHTWTELIIAPHLSDFLQAYPDIVLDIECNDKRQDIIADQLDLVIRVGVLRDSSYVAVPFGQISIVLVAAPAYLAKHGVPQSADDLAQHNFVMFEDYHQLLVGTPPNQRTITVSGRIKLNSVQMMLAAVRQNIGMSALPNLVVKSMIESGEVVTIMPDAKIEIKGLPIHQVFAMYSNRKHLSAKVRVFLDFFRERLI
jgi:DNA-binding transcriptional LysR family regulator